MSVKDKGSLNGYVTKSVIFEVSQTWKGVKETQIEITTGQGGGDCGIDFQKGGEYLVFARDDNDMYGKKELVTILCDRTKELALSKEDLESLGLGQSPIKQVDISADKVNLNMKIWIVIFVFGSAVLIGLFSWKRMKKA